MRRDPLSAQAIARLIVERLESWWSMPEISLARDAVPVVRIVGGLDDQLLASASGDKSGRRILRLDYDWREIEGEIYRSDVEFAREILPTLTSDGAIIRARLRAARRGTMVTK